MMQELARAAALTVLHASALQTLMTQPGSPESWGRYIGDIGRQRWLKEARIILAIPPLELLEIQDARRYLVR